MCGIVGTLNFGSEGPVEESLMRAMLGAVRHRGPDEFGIYLDRGAEFALGLGHARLSIIDLGGGQQPISNEDGSIWIVFNGEIFNYIELQEELRKRGHQLATSTDTEVIVHLYEEDGIDCVKHLNGQFAFAIWDARKEQLFLARDRLGIRPLYWTSQGGFLSFASELKSLFVDPRLSAELDPVALDQVFTYWSPLAPRTAFRGIQTLPPGHRLVIDGKRRQRIERYWGLQFPAAGAERRDDADTCAEQLRDLLVDAARLRLRADVPVGAYLSGGLDSSAITAFVRQHFVNHLETFSIGFEDEAFDESVFQQQMAQHLGTKHHFITCTHEEIGQAFPDVIWHTEVPILRTAPVPLFLLSKLVQDVGFKVVLTGEGADEILCGYNIFKETKIRRFWARQPESTWRPALLRKLYAYVGNLGQADDSYLRKFFGQGLEDVDSPSYSHDIRWNNTSRCKRMFSDRLRAELAGVPDEPLAEKLSLPSDFTSWHPITRAQYLEGTIFLAGYLLSSQGDRMGMAHSLEGRFPFLDHRVVEFCNELAPSRKLPFLNEKQLLKRCTRDLLPERVHRRPKQPYRAPIQKSFFPNGKPLEWVAEILSPAEIEASGCFNPKATEQLVKKVQRFDNLGETDNMALAGLLSTQLVHRRFVDDFCPSRPLDERDNVKVVSKNL